jgi:hypothetical protein
MPVKILLQNEADPEAGLKDLGNIFILELYPETAFNDEVRSNISNFLQQGIQTLTMDILHKQIDLKIGMIDVICVTEGIVMGDIIADIQESKGLKYEMTGKTGYYQTMGKTISYYSGNEIRSSIVIDDAIWFNVITAINSGVPYEEWDYPAQLSCYLIAHEIGHAIDAQQRRQISEDMTVTEDETDWEVLSEHFAPLLYSEFIASLHGNPVITPKVQQDAIESWNEDFEKMVERLLTARNAFMSHIPTVIGYFWIILVQLAKLIGQEWNKEGLPEIKFEKPEWEDEEIAVRVRAVIDSLRLALVDLTKTYPENNDDAVVIERLKPVFLELAMIYNFYFREEDVPKGEFENED